jgi:hypothetical protein
VVDPRSGHLGGNWRCSRLQCAVCGIIEWRVRLGGVDIEVLVTKREPHRTVVAGEPEAEQSSKQATTTKSSSSEHDSGDGCQPGIGAAVDASRDSLDTTGSTWVGLPSRIGGCLGDRNVSNVWFERGLSLAVHGRSPAVIGPTSLEATPTAVD